MINAKLFMEILQDKHFYDLKKLQYKYGESAVKDTVSLLKETVYKSVPVNDFYGQLLVFCPSLINILEDTYKSLLTNSLNQPYSISKMEDEIESTLAIENIHSSRNSIRSILQGAAPKTPDENKIYGLKKGLDFISDKSNKITEANLYRLYMLAIGDYLKDNEKILPGNYYRHDNVYIVGNAISHQELNHRLLKQYMAKFISFINAKDNLSVVVKSVILHFYLAYLHPYFDGNGRMARLLHLWYLLQNDFNATMLVSFSQLISHTKSAYYKAFEIVEENHSVSNVIDVTPFITYFNTNVFSKLQSQKTCTNLLEKFQRLIDCGKITAKEKELFIFVLTNYNSREFSTKQLEKDHKNAAYATIRSFVLKFAEFGLLSSQKYGNRVKYRVNG